MELSGKVAVVTGGPGHESSHKLSQSDRDSKSWGRVTNEGLPVLSRIFQQHLEKAD